MEPARSIAKLGFSKWYERRLYESYAWLITALLCLIVVAAILEGLSFRGNAVVVLGRAGGAFVAGLIAWHSARRFLQLLAEAVRLGSHATCPSCRKYAAFDVITESPRMSVRCRKCAHQWTFD